MRYSRGDHSERLKIFGDLLRACKAENSVLKKRVQLLEKENKKLHEDARKASYFTGRG